MDAECPFTVSSGKEEIKKHAAKRGRCWVGKQMAAPRVCLVRGRRSWAGTWLRCYLLHMPLRMSMVNKLWNENCPQQEVEGLSGQHSGKR